MRAILISAVSSELEELKGLADTAGVEAAAYLTQGLNEPHPDYYLGSGKLEELKRIVASTGVKLVIADDELTPRQERNLEKTLEVGVLDRTALIMDIFASHATTAEGKLQVELAQLEYNLSRMRGLWQHLERLGGGIGTRGPGESQLETDRRLARDRIHRLRKELEKIETQREVATKTRKESSLPHIAIVGYTNAGKSTLFNRLTSAQASVADQLFHTLDTTVRKLELDGIHLTISDTVGFIDKLPHQLVAAFKATLQDAIDADYLIQVADASNPNLSRDLTATESILKTLGITDKPKLMVLNKADLLSADQLRDLSRHHPEAELISLKRDWGYSKLLNQLVEALKKDYQLMDLEVPYTEHSLLKEIGKLAKLQDLIADAHGYRFKAYLNAKQRQIFKNYFHPTELRP